ncbi:MAG TPA: TIR domain-containing protein [Nitrospira sp.]|nr:TIR domain-containing protein [Nitrospira sp.]
MTIAADYEEKGGGVNTFFDALHGRIHLGDLDPDTQAPIRNIIAAPFFQRLRRIKQLGFVSQNFLSAQHNRYAHALGTAHLIRKIIAQVERHGTALSDALPAARALSGGVPFEGANASQKLKQHLLVAALIQDVGEMPYEKSTAGLFKPDRLFLDTVRDSGLDPLQIRAKHVFTLFHVWDRSTYKKYLDGLNQEVLTFLISGQVNRGHIDPGLLALREMIDGTLDADRLDYVYRDAFHTIGVHHSAESVIDSIVDYDHVGPKLSQVRPVTDFIVTRASLWSNVYLSPENRFRLILLRTILNKLRDYPDLAREVFNTNPFEVSEEGFIGLHDQSVDDALVKLVPHSSRLGGDAHRALTLLMRGAEDYEYRWVPRGSREAGEWRSPLPLPNEFYYDTYADYRTEQHTLYKKNSIRVVGDRYELLDEPTYLEDCIGPFCSLLQQPRWTALPMPDHMSWFLPRGALDSGGLWTALRKNMDTCELTRQLEARDPINGVSFIFDTRHRPEFSPPAIFISFAWEDREFAERVARLLFEKERKYFALLGPSKGVGKSTVKTSQEAVDEAGAVILICSSDYVRIYRDEAEGALHAEVSRMEARIGELPIAIVSLDDFEDVSGRLPFGSLSPEGRIPFLGGALRRAPTSQFRETLEEALAFLNKRLGSDGS